MRREPISAGCGRSGRKAAGDGRRCLVNVACAEIGAARFRVCCAAPTLDPAGLSPNEAPSLDRAQVAAAPAFRLSPISPFSPSDQRGRLWRTTLYAISGSQLEPHPLPRVRVPYPATLGQGGSASLPGAGRDDGLRPSYRLSPILLLLALVTTPAPARIANASPLAVAAARAFVVATLFRRGCRRRCQLSSDFARRKHPLRSRSSTLAAFSRPRLALWTQRWRPNCNQPSPC